MYDAPELSPDGPDDGSAVSGQPAGLQVEQIAHHAWRVSECSGDAAPLPLLLEFIEQRSDGFEVMQLGVTFDWCTFDTLPLALDHMKGTASESLAGKTSGDLGWIT